MSDAMAALLAIFVLALLSGEKLTVYVDGKEYQISLAKPKEGEAQDER